MTGEPLRLDAVTYTAGRPILHGIDLTFEPGRMTALSGPSGSGKTTLLSIAGGLLEPTSGTTSYAGAPMWRGTGDPRPEVAFVLQVYGLVPILSARENVSVALRARGVRPREADERAQEALVRFHIGDLGDRQVEELSGGQMQRVALARGLCVGAGVLLADEPTSELDEVNRGLVLAELRAEADRGAVVVVATHDPAVVEACDVHHLLDEGRLTGRVAAVGQDALDRLAHPERHVVADAAPPPLAASVPVVEPVRHLAQEAPRVPPAAEPLVPEPVRLPERAPDEAPEPTAEHPAKDAAFRRPDRAAPDGPG